MNKHLLKKIGLLALILGLLGLFFALDLHHWLTLERLKTHLDAFKTQLAATPLQVSAAFFVAYVLVTALSIPGATVMSLAAGALFGLFWGVLLVSFASSLGALLAFLASRYVLRDGVQNRFGDRLQAINDGMAKDGVFYLLTLRLLPIFPFFLVNLLMGLTPLRAITFYWVSQVGMFPATVVYLNAGTQLGQVQHLSGIVSPGLLASFVLLGLFPLVVKWVLAQIQRRRVYAGWNRPRHFDRNLVVIGAGAGGLVTAYIAAAVRARVTLVEAHKMGGDCLNYGCVPSKALIRTAKLAQQMRHAQRYGLENTEPALAWPQVMQRLQAVIRAIEPHDSPERYTGLGVEVIAGYARLIDPWTVEIQTPDGSVQRLTTRTVVLATGARPYIPKLPGLDTVSYVTSDTLWEDLAHCETLPPRWVVLGGGPIGCELAQSFARLGASVTQVEMAPRILLREEAEVAALITAQLQQDGVTVLTGHQAVCCERVGADQILVVKAADGSEQRLVFDRLLCAVGRVARLEGYGLDTLGIATGRTLTTNAYLQTRYPHIYAVGDVTGPYQLTHAAAHQAGYAAVNALFGGFKRTPVDYRVIPWVTFTDPEVARVGLNELEASAQGIPYQISRYELSDLDRAITDSATLGFIQVLTVPGKDKILGVTIVSEHAGELLAEFVLAMKHGLGLNSILGTIHSYPTWAEANKQVAGVWKRAHIPQWALVWLHRYHAVRRT